MRSDTTLLTVLHTGPRAHVRQRRWNVARLIVHASSSVLVLHARNTTAVDATIEQARVVGLTAYGVLVDLADLASARVPLDDVHQVIGDRSITTSKATSWEGSVSSSLIVGITATRSTNRGGAPHRGAAPRWLPKSLQT